MLLAIKTIINERQRPTFPTTQPNRKYIITPRIVRILGVKTPKNVPKRFCVDVSSCLFDGDFVFNRSSRFVIPHRQVVRCEEVNDILPLVIVRPPRSDLIDQHQTHCPLYGFRPTLTTFKKCRLRSDSPRSRNTTKGQVVVSQTGARQKNGLSDASLLKVSSPRSLILMDTSPSGSKH